MVKTQRLKVHKPHRLLFKKRLSRSFSGDTILFIILLAGALFMVLPMVFAISSSLKTPDEFWVFPPRLFPRNPTTKSFTDLFVLMTDSWVPFSRYIFNTFFVTIAGTTGHVLIASLCAYPLAKYRFPGSNFFFHAVIFSLMFGTAVTAIPNYLIMSKLGIINTYGALIIPAFGSSLGLFLMKQFMEQNIPDSLLEAATIDGANEGIIFFRIVMPLVKPAWLTLIIFSVQALWGIGNTPLVYSEELKTLSYAFSQIQSAGIARAGVGAAIGVVMMIVPVTVFIITQSNIVETMATSGMKD
jgi:ABC-type glycerol-3-phosphate transport system permease component